MQFQICSQNRTRREFLQSVPLFAAAAAFGAEKQTPPAFIAINDLHYLTKDCGRWFRVMVGEMKAAAPGAAFCLMCGDLADRGARPAYESLREIFGGLGVPLYPVPGNHDYTPEGSREHYDAVFEKRLNYRFVEGGWQFLGLDTTQGTASKDTKIAESTLAWLDAEPLDRELPTVVFTHFPLGEGVSMRPLNAGALLERLEKLNLVAALSGHWHGASERLIPHGDKKAVLQTSRCSARVRKNADNSPLKGWWLCQAQADGTLARRFVEFHPPAGIPEDDTSGKK